jgi:hypothetical protein
MYSKELEWRSMFFERLKNFCVVPFISAQIKEEFRKIKKILQNEAERLSEDEMRKLYLSASYAETKTLPLDLDVAAIKAGILEVFDLKKLSPRDIVFLDIAMALVISAPDEKILAAVFSA